jgi:hypothetical protein
MTQGYAAPYPIFDGLSCGVASKPFFISPGWMAEFLAFNFAQWRVRPSAACPLMEQQACLSRIIYKNFEPPEADVQPCGVLPDVTGYKPEILAETRLVTEGCPWSLSACRNYRMLDLPGAYRFILNDPAAAGNVLIYMLAHPLSGRPARPSRLYFGE